MKTMQKALLVCAAAMFTLWIVLNFGLFRRAEIGVGHMALGVVFALLILLRPKPKDVEEVVGVEKAATAAIAAVAGVVSFAAGIVFDTGQLEWIGVLFLLYAAMHWSLPARFSRDTLLSILLLYWIHPIPGTVLAALHRAMQEVSVHGAELILHAFNFRVWADGSVLHTAVMTFMVPEACSGMMTAMTVLVCSAGISILLRFGWLRASVLLAAGLVQVVLLNMVRISLMVVFADPAQPRWADQFLHDSLGVLLLVSVILVQVEAAWWRSLDPGESGEPEVPESPAAGASIRRLPLFWQPIFHRPGIILLLVLGTGIAVFMLLRCRPHHRAEMIAAVATDLVHSDPAEAERACRAALKLEAGNNAVRKELVRALLLRGANDEAIRELDRIPAKVRQADPDHAVLLAWGLVGTGRPDAAVNVVSNLAGVVGRDLPGVAMVQAEFAARSGDANVVAEMVVKASRSVAMIHRIRHLFPFLAAQGRWEAIAKSDNNVPYRDVTHALISIEAWLAQKNAPGAARVLTRVLSTHGHDPRLLKYLYVFATLWPGSDWESTFSEKLVANLDKLSPDDLGMWVECSFRLRRPDLAWLTYNRLKELEPDHPAVSMLPAWFGDVWFTFRKRFVGLSSGVEDEPISLTPDTYYYLVRTSTPWKKKVWRDIPLVGELYAATGDERRRVVEAKRNLLRRAIVEFASRESKAPLSLPMKYMYTKAFELAGQPDYAQASLAWIQANHASESNKVLLARAGIYRRKSDWQGVYETLRVWGVRRDAPLPVMVMFCESQFRLTLGVCALETARQAIERFPFSSQVAALQIRLANAFLSPEETLFAIERSKSRFGGFELMEVDSLLKTERFTEARVFDGSATAGDDIGFAPVAQAMVLPAAELSLQWGTRNLPSAAEFERNARILDSNKSRLSSPFMRGLVQRWLACYRSKCAAGDADPDKWAACGRDNMERAAALHQLALLLSRHEKTAGALAAIRRAVAELPRSGLLRRTLIGLVPHDPKVIDEAYAMCPSDPEIWLARLVVMVESGKPEAWAIDEARNAVASRVYSASTMVRAGDFLLRRGMVKAAAVAAVDAESRARGLVPAHVLALRCAERLQDRRWALSATARAIEHSVTTQPYLCGKMVEFWSKVEKPDWDVLFALGRLRTLEPANPLWMEMLGRARFLAGGSHNIDARDQMKNAIEAGYTNRTSFLLLAEAERRLGNLRDGIKALRRGLELFPGDHAMLNNLAYMLAETPETLPEAVALVPALLKVGGKNADILDTVELVYMRSGRMDLAEKVIADELLFVKEHSTAWARARLRLAQVRLKEGRLDTARAILADIMKSCPLEIPADDLYDLGKLMGEIEGKLFDQKWPSDLR